VARGLLDALKRPRALRLPANTTASPIGCANAIDALRGAISRQHIEACRQSDGTVLLAGRFAAPLRQPAQGASALESGLLGLRAGPGAVRQSAGRLKIIPAAGRRPGSLKAEVIEGVDLLVVLFELTGGGILLRHTQGPNRGRLAR